MTFVLKGVPLQNFPSSVPIAVVESAVLATWRLLSHSQLLVGANGRFVAVWVYSTADVPQQNGPDPQGGGVIWLSKRARDLLLFNEAELQVQVTLPERLHVEVFPALVDDLPSGYEADASEEVIKQLGPGRWVLLVSKGWSMPILLRKKTMKSGRIRLSMLTRTLVSAGAPATESVQIESRDRGLVFVSGLWLPATYMPPKLTGPTIDGAPTVQISRLVDDRIGIREAIRKRWYFGRRFGIAVAVLFQAPRVAVHLTEMLLRPLLKAPSVALRTSEANVGDDSNQVVRLASSVLPLLGVRAGDQVIVSWAGRQVMATALTAASVSQVDREMLTALQRVDLQQRRETTLPLEHLTVGISAEMRADLGIPRCTVVTVRRRLVTLFLSRLNELTIPVGGLLLAAFTISGISMRLIIAGLLFVTTLAMLPARYKTPPRGRWL